MSVVSIDLKEFNSLNPARSDLAAVLLSEKAWFADSNRNIIGTITLDHTDKDWGYAILARHEDGRYRFIDGEISIGTLEDAEKGINSVMTMMEARDQAAEVLFQLSPAKASLPDSSVLVTDITAELKKYLDKHPEKLYDLSARKFEELVASILEDLGFEVELTQATRDGKRA